MDNADLLSASNATSQNAAAASAAAASAGQTVNTTIEAKPQLKNLIGDATRFVPTALKVRRVVRDPSGRVVTVGGGPGMSASLGVGTATIRSQ
ncbi:unnamed protein product [Echinostoma caproni]|uniref:Uncharacterized protein n=1 Tax=Echinostoma caproni TaxID=27848 RepID=A0A3P8GCJ8_9TREM|nr:unnamed protein product [Echinostoma caproni]